MSQSQSVRLVARDHLRKAEEAVTAAVAVDTRSTRARVAAVLGLRRPPRRRPRRARARASRARASRRASRRGTASAAGGSPRARRRRRRRRDAAGGCGEVVEAPNATAVHASRRRRGIAQASDCFTGRLGMSRARGAAATSVLNNWQVYGMFQGHDDALGHAVGCHVDRAPQRRCSAKGLQSAVAEVELRGARPVVEGASTRPSTSAGAPAPSTARSRSRRPLERCGGRRNEAAAACRRRAAWSRWSTPSARRRSSRAWPTDARRAARRSLPSDPTSPRMNT